MTTEPPPFVYRALPMRVRFGPGATREIGQESADLGFTRVLAIASPGHVALAERIAAPLGERCVGILAEARMHVPIEVAERGRAEADRLGADGLIAVGGGSAIGLAKAIALTSGRPIIAVPTTYAGSEMTSIWGLTDGGAKRTGRDANVLPAAVIYDPELTLDLPIAISVTSGVNALAHGVEALYAPDVSPVIALMAEEGIRSMLDALPAIAAAPSGIDARSRALYGAWLCGACLGATTMSLHHRLCHALGGMLDLPHAPTHAVVLPHVLAYNLPAIPEVAATLRAITSASDPATAVWQWATRLGAPRSLRELGMAEADVERVAEQVTATPYANPRPADRDEVARLLHAAWAGEPPR